MLSIFAPDSATIKIERQGWMTRVPHKCAGRVLDSSGNIKLEIQGRWSEYLELKTLDGTTERVWQAEERHPQANRYYFFPYFTMNLNYLDEDMKKHLPPTDCRLRMD